MVSLQRIAIPLLIAKIPTKTKNFRSISDSDVRRFKIQTNDMGAPPGRASGLEITERDLFNTQD